MEDILDFYAVEQLFYLVLININSYHYINYHLLSVAINTNKVIICLKQHEKPVFVVKQILCFTSIKKHKKVIFSKNNKIDKMNSKILICGTRTTGFVHGGGNG
jgi:hypothetical protein